MHFLVGLILAVVLLYFWLVGHWFARVLVFLMFWPFFSAGVGAAVSVSVDAVYRQTSQPTPAARTASAPEGPAVNTDVTDVERAFRKEWGLPPKAAAGGDISDEDFLKMTGGSPTGSKHPEPPMVVSIVLLALIVGLGGLGAWVAASLPIWRQRRLLSPTITSAG
jgi:hypothetical protein